MLLLMTLLHPHREERLSGGGTPNHPKEPTWSSHVIASPAMAKPCAGKQEAQTPPWSLGKWHLGSESCDNGRVLKKQQNPPNIA